MARSFEIVNGPNKFDLMVSHYHGEGNDRQSVDFVLADEGGQPRTVAVFIWSAEREGMHDSEQWVLNGLIVGREDQHFPASYSTKTRKGHYWPKDEHR